MLRLSLLLACAAALWLPAPRHRAARRRDTAPRGAAASTAEHPLERFMEDARSAAAAQEARAAALEADADTDEDVAAAASSRALAKELRRTASRAYVAWELEEHKESFGIDDADGA
ncbi:hypothetical protein M885DRAFT_531311 [Pelagophyceae sp. CCMP2097]|nr:hypothetical protein M885DRAFT_531311 [Pelagophyceae sp. CCMP2097]